MNKSLPPAEDWSKNGLVKPNVLAETLWLVAALALTGGTGYIELTQGRDLLDLLIVIFIPILWFNIRLTGIKIGQMFAGKAPICEQTGRDLPVKVAYLYRGVLLGIDRGYLGSRREGLCFIGRKTDFLVDPTKEDTEDSMAYGKCLKLTLDKGPNVYTIFIAADEKFDFRLRLRASDTLMPIRDLITVDRSDAPRSTVHTPPPMTASPHAKRAAVLEKSMVVLSGIVLSSVTIVGFVWWAAYQSDDLNLRVTVGLLLSIVILGVAVVFFRDVWPEIVRTEQVFSELDGRAVGPPEEVPKS